VIRTFLQEADLTELPVEVVISAMTNSERGEEVMVALEQSFGSIDLTEHTLLSLLRTGYSMRLLPERIKPEHITEEVFIAAIESNSDRTLQTVIEGSNHVPITLSVFRSGNPGCFRFLWNRAHPEEVPQALIKAAAESNFGHFKFLLTEAEEVRPEESLLIAIARQGRDSIRMFELLLEREIPLKITSNVIRRASRMWDQRVLPVVIESYP